VKRPHVDGPSATPRAQRRLEAQVMSDQEVVDRIVVVLAGPAFLVESVQPTSECNFLKTSRPMKRNTALHHLYWSEFNFSRL
jgi:hypothetical protein